MDFTLLDDWYDVKLRWFEFNTEMKGENLDYEVTFQILNPGEATDLKVPRLSIKLIRKTEKYLRESILPTCFFVMAACVRTTFSMTTSLIFSSNSFYLYFYR